MHVRCGDCGRRVDYVASAGVCEGCGRHLRLLPGLDPAPDPGGGGGRDRPAEEGTRRLDVPVSPRYGPALAIGAAHAVFLLLASGNALTAQITLMAALGYLGGAAVMVARRPRTPTEVDLWLLRLGFIPLWYLTQDAARGAWTWLGRL
ncbi:MAG: hypothetical protein C0501_25880 [Isosphaera sp.]|nr:hypothetical protein [Isosphaera sp.]